MTCPERDVAVVRVLNDIEALRRLLRLYPPSHPSLQPARERLRERVLGLGAEGEVMTASFGPGRLFWNGQEIAVPPIMPAARLAPLLFHLGLAAVRLTLPEAADGAVALAAKLAALGDPPGEADRLALLEQSAEFPGVELVPIDLSGVQLLDSSEHPESAGTRPVWSELAQRLSRDGASPLDGLAHDGELDPGSIANLVAAAADPQTLFDHLFRQLAEIVRDTPEPRRPASLAQVREYFAEVIRLLDPERRALAVVTGSRHLPLASLDDPWVARETLLEAVERMLMQGLEIPAELRKALEALASPPSADGPAAGQDDGASRARHLLDRIALEGDGGPPPSDAALPPPTDWGATPWAKELSDSLTDEQVKQHLVRLLQEAITLWPDEAVAERAAVRLAEEFVAALELEDLETATRLAPLVAATRSEEAIRLCTESGVAVAVRLLHSADKNLHGDLTAILVTLGERGIPAILAALEDEENLTVRRRLLEAVASHGLRAAQYVRPLLDDTRWFVVRNAVFLLRRIGDTGALPLLRAHLAACHPKVLVELLKALVSLQDPDWLRVLERTIDSDDERARVALAVASLIRRPEVTALLVERLNLRQGKRLKEPRSLELIRALGALGDPAALPALRTIVTLKRWRYAFSLDAARREAAGAIARLEGPEARQLARTLAAGSDRGMAEAVRAAMHARPEAREDDG